MCKKVKEIGALRVCEQTANMLMSHKATVLLFSGLGQCGLMLVKAASVEMLNTHTHLKLTKLKWEINDLSHYGIF